MAESRSAGKGSQRLSAVIPRSRRLPPTYTSETHPKRRPHFTRPDPDTSTTTMLRGAVQKHEEQTARSQPRSSQDFFGSSPPDLPRQQSASQSINPGYRNPLKPASSSALNSARGWQQARGAVTGVKRTASGLAKALDGGFDDGPGSQQQPIMVGDRTGGRAQTHVSFDENEFDSDIDLDVEEPMAKQTVSYPKLSQQPSMSAPEQPVVYPTLPRRQQWQPTLDPDRSVRDSGYASIEPATTAATRKSSQPLPWSSSPVEHYASTRLPLAKFIYAPGSTGQAKPNDLPPAPSMPEPPKRRTLPWLSQESKQAEEGDQNASSTAMSTKSRVKGGADFTPLPKDSKKSAYPWNTTASAIKDQQKQLREQNRKKSVKENEATEESVRKAKSTRARPARVFLSEEQQHVLELVTEHKKSVFFTGSAGTGKSVLLREIIAALRKKYQREPDRVAVTASTGLAACNVGGVTLHSFAGIGLGKEDAPELVRKIKKNQKAKHRWMRTKVLIIDEVSMVDADLFDKLESIARSMRNNGRPFGGIQLVITGDFFQLPPVPDYGRVSKFAFDAATWNTTIEHTIGLHHVFRQKDPVFAGMLNEMREGRLTESSIRAFRSLNREPEFKDQIDSTELFPTRAEVEKANHERLHLLQGESFVFETRDGGAIVDKAQRDKLLQNCMAPEIITLKKGAQVMLIKNVDESLVNGSIGRVIGFMSEQQFDTYSANEDLFCPSPGGTVPSSHDDRLSEEQRALVHTSNGAITTSRKYPVVRFSIADGTSRDLLCQPETWKVELPNGEVQASRNQVPLILAWALSIHKAQGQTLERVKVDLGKVFEKGQAYVALSRATSMAGLQVLRFDPKKVVAHERVRNFYSNLSRVELAEKNKERMGGGKKVGVRAEEYEKMFVGDGL